MFDPKDIYNFVTTLLVDTSFLPSKNEGQSLEERQLTSSKLAKQFNLKSPEQSVAKLAEALYISLDSYKIDVPSSVRSYMVSLMLSRLAAASAFKHKGVGGDDCNSSLVNLYIYLDKPCSYDEIFNCERINNAANLISLSLSTNVKAVGCDVYPAPDYTLNEFDCCFGHGDVLPVYKEKILSKGLYFIRFEVDGLRGANNLYIDNETHKQLVDQFKSQNLSPNITLFASAYTFVRDVFSQAAIDAYDRIGGDVEIILEDSKLIVSDKTNSFALTMPPAVATELFLLTYTYFNQKGGKVFSNIIEELTTMMNRHDIAKAKN
ncbi:hypothetical protein [Vibrio harveyi]|uniref:hypothetical protein n=1 Tax=Vibrio harveyi TaxID=669 RepID=UPI003D70F751